MRAKSLLICIAAVLLLAPAPVPPRVPVYLLFPDVTSSLSPDEINRVGEVTSSVLGALPPGTRFAVYAVQKDANQPPIVEGTIPIARSGSTRDVVAATRSLKELRTKVRAAIDTLYCTYNCNDASAKQLCRERQFTPQPQDDLRSCILKRLNQAALKAGELRKQPGTTVELVFISDMIEECEKTPLGKTVRLTHPRLDGDIAAVRQYKNLPDLQKARVTVIVPRSLYGSNLERNSRPDLEELERYWKTVFSAAQADMNQWYFGSEIPEHLRRVVR